MKFWLRDAESESIRTRFMQIWDYLDDAKRYNLQQLRTHPFARKMLTTTAMIMLFIYNLIVLSAEFPSLFLKEDLDNPLFVLMLAFLILLSSLPAFCFYFSLQDRLKAYVDAALSQRYIIDTVARLIVPPSLFALLAHGEFSPLILSLYALIFGYLGSMGAVIIIFMLVYLPVRSFILFFREIAYPSH